jgi:hypothetical protein
MVDEQAFSSLVSSDTLKSTRTNRLPSKPFAGPRKLNTKIRVFSFSKKMIPAGSKPVFREILRPLSSL